MEADEDTDEERSCEERFDTLQVLNMHLGKAGGLNFGLEGLIRLGILPPQPTFPMMFGIIDARHSCDGRWWTQVLPAFYFLEGDADEKVSFETHGGVRQALSLREYVSKLGSGQKGVVRCYTQPPLLGDPLALAQRRSNHPRQ